MTTKQSTVDYILEQLSSVKSVAAKKMFGEYAIYCGAKVVALVCDEQLFVKQTVAGKKFIGRVKEAPPYKGAKPYYLISGDRLEDQDWVSELIKISAAELPAPKPKKNILPL